jgi:hypothetical protein
MSGSGLGSRGSWECAAEVWWSLARLREEVGERGPNLTDLLCVGEFDAESEDVDGVCRGLEIRRPSSTLVLEDF